MIVESQINAKTMKNHIKLINVYYTIDEYIKKFYLGGDLEAKQMCWTK
jgi:hypothetical protein